MTYYVNHIEIKIWNHTFQ